MQKKPLLLLSILLLFSILNPAIHAQDFDITAKSITNEIYPNQTAEIVINITNHYTTTERFRFEFPIDMLFIPETKPIRFSGALIKPNETAVTTIYLSPKNIDPGWYSYQIYIRPENIQGAKRVSIPIFIKEPTPKSPPSLKPRVILSSFRITSDGIIDPRKDLRLELKFKNKNLLDIENMDIKAVSHILGSYDKFIQLEPLGVDSVTYTFDYPNDILPQPDNISVYWTVNDTTFGPEIFYIDITGYTIPLQTLDTSNNTLFTRSYSVTLNNIGTLPVKKQFRKQVPFMGNRYTKLTPPSEDIVTINDTKFYVWNIHIDPKQSTTIVMHTDYTPLALIAFSLLLIIIIATILYQYFKSGIQVRKRAIVIQTGPDGLTRYKVMLYLKNKTNLKLTNLQVVEILPTIIKVLNNFSLGTIKPKKILHNRHKGTLLRWDISSLEPSEERIITYFIQSRLSIMGNIVLDTAKVRYQQGNRNRIKSSNKVIPSSVYQ